MTLKKQAAHALGLAAEARAAEHLRALGYTILAQRLRTKSGEVDVLATHSDTLIFVEVKARAREVDALESITPAKQKRLARAAEALLAEPEKIGGLDPMKTPNIRFDVVVVSPQGLRHIPDAWRPDDAVL